MHRCKKIRATKHAFVLQRRFAIFLNIADVNIFKLAYKPQWCTYNSCCGRHDQINYCNETHFGGTKMAILFSGVYIFIIQFTRFCLKKNPRL